MIDKARVIREVREAADMDHPWIPGARADLIRDAADLLEAGSDLKKILEDMPDLEDVRSALSRETVIRQIMAETSEPRNIVTEMVDAARSMNDEAVLELTDGEPTTLRDALGRYVEQLETVEEQATEDVVDALNAILTYPWPQEEAIIMLHDNNQSVKLEIGYPEDDEHVVIKVGGYEVASANHDDHGWDGMHAATDTAEAVHRAVLARVIADRDHHIQLSSTDRRSLLAWLERPNGSWNPDNGGRVSVDAVEGGGILVRTRPYQYIPAPKTRV